MFDKHENGAIVAGLETLKHLSARELYDHFDKDVAHRITSIWCVDGAGLAGFKLDDLIRKVNVMSAEEEELDELVIDAKSREASEINNAGREAQLKYLLGGADV
jgi:hypothetical protein